MICTLCPRQCKAVRTETENKNGFCKMPLYPKVARADLHFGEEPVISGTNGSGTVFFSGCSLSCVFCQNYEISHQNKGRIITYKELADIFYELEQKSAHNINLVNPTHYVYTIKKALEFYKPNIPIVYNSGGYDSKEALEIAKDFVDIYLLDFKYLSSQRAEIYSKAKKYPEIAGDALKQCYTYINECIIENGIMKKGIIVRHLLMPQATREAMGIFDFVRKNTPNAYFSLMSQYIPYGEALTMPVINRSITKREYEKVIEYILEFEFENVFIQDRKSADSKFIPKFDF